MKSVKKILLTLIFLAAASSSFAKSTIEPIEPPMPKAKMTPLLNN